jgi:putative SbcD/Mre11-related phosphoesterase
MFEGWQLTPYGAAIHLREQTAVIADLHLGYEWARGAAGDCIPAHSLAEVLASLAGVLGAARVSRLIVAGDLVESARDCDRTSADLGALRTWLAARGVSLLAIAGNHDTKATRRGSATSSAGLGLPGTTVVGGWTIAHGHEPLAGPRTISGHHHPIFRHAGAAAPCFLIGPGRIMLPAFSRNAAGCDVTSTALPADWRSPQVRCIVCAGSELLDFGRLSDLKRRLRRASSRRNASTAPRRSR